jgi:hypothetical protein
MAEVSKSEMLRPYSKEVQSGDAALFVGAGLSQSSGFVNWKQLMRDVASELFSTSTVSPTLSPWPGIT